MRKLGPQASLLLLASIVVSFLASSSAPTPLYSIYQHEWGFTPITTTVVFGIYAVAVLFSLLTVGGISDHIGRRPVLFAALGAQAVATIVFVFAGGVHELVIARVIQGLATGAAAGAVGAALLDVNRERGTFANSVAPGIGTGSGAIVSAIAIQFLPAPTHTIFFILLAVFALQAVALLFVKETATQSPGALASLKPEVKIPAAARRPFIAAAPVMFAVWSMAGFYGALAPSIVHAMSTSTSYIFSGLGLFIMAAVAFVAVIALQKVSATNSLYISTVTLITGLVFVIVAINSSSLVGFFLATAVTGFGFGTGFQGSIRLLLPKAQLHERAGLLSAIYVVSYLGLGVPAVIAGISVVDGPGLIATAQDYGVAVIALALIALIALLKERSGTREETARQEVGSLS